jgi:membrane-associated phospholipid phosphatase
MELLTSVWILISYFGSIIYWLGFALSFILIYPFLRKKDKENVKWVLHYLLPAILLSYVSSSFLKIIFKIPRICIGFDYCPETYAFPSGHATIALAFSTIIFLQFRKNPKIYIPAFILSLLICYSRLVLNVHTIFDVISGAIVGVIISSIWYLFRESRKQ